MSFIQRDEYTGKAYAPGFFLADNEHCTRITKTIKADDNSVKTADNGGKYVPMGATYKETVAGESDGATTEKVVGVVYEDVDVSFGDMPGSVVTAGTIYKNRLVTPDDAAELEKIGFTIIDEEPAVTRPEL